MRLTSRQSALFIATSAIAMSLSTLVTTAQPRIGHELATPIYNLADLKAEAAHHTVNIYGP